MGIAYSLENAVGLLAGLDVGERKKLLRICQRIHQAQQSLSRTAAPILTGCITDCQGLCCRNLRPADIITVYDLVYALTLAPQLKNDLVACVADEPFYPADCLFLENGLGPCLFPEFIRPERCIVSFCRVEPLLEKDIRRVRGQFNRLIRFFAYRRLRRLVQRARACWPPNRKSNS